MRYNIGDIIKCNIRDDDRFWIYEIVKYEDDVCSAQHYIGLVIYVKGNFDKSNIRIGKKIPFHIHNVEQNKPHLYILRKKLSRNELYKTVI